MRRCLRISLCAAFLSGNLAFGQDIHVKIGTPAANVGPVAPIAPPAAANVDPPNAIRAVAYTNPSYATAPPAAAAPAVAATNSSAFPVVALAAPYAEAASSPAPAYAAFAEPFCDQWTGFHVGLNTGAAIGYGATADSAAFTSPTLGGNPLLSSSGHDAPTAWVFGGQLGYDRQLAFLVFGAEADWERTAQRESSDAFTPPGTLAFFGAGANGFGYSLTDEHRLTDIGTLRLRGGIVAGDSLLYATGGLAWGTAKETLSYRGSANPLIFPAALQPGPFLPFDASFSQTKVGYGIGGGIETRLSAHWSFKAEYLFVGLGRVNHAVPIGINPAFGPAFTGGTAFATSSWAVNDNLLRFGLNYRF